MRTLLAAAALLGLLAMVGQCRAADVQFPAEVRGTWCADGHEHYRRCDLPLGDGVDVAGAAFTIEARRWEAFEVECKPLEVATATKGRGHYVRLRCQVLEQRPTTDRLRLQIIGGRLRVSDDHIDPGMVVRPRPH